MSSVTVNPPKTPVTEKSNGTAPASIPNVCKMPGPPAPFVPTPLPNIGQSRDNLAKCTTTVKIEGAKIAIKGSYFMSKGDIASKGTGGGLVSATTHGKTEFVAPGSMDVKAQGKNIQFLGDAMTNNGNISNSGTPTGELQDALGPGEAQEICNAICDVVKEWPNKKKKKGDTKQKEVAKKLSGDGPMWTAKKGSSIIPEVSYKIPGGLGKKFLRLIKSATDRLIEGTKNIASGSMARGLNVAGALGKGNVVRWDIVVVKNPSQAPIPSNVKKYVEVKFPGDTDTKNQIKAKKKMKDKDKQITIGPADCGC